MYDTYECDIVFIYFFFFECKIDVDAIDVYTIDGALVFLFPLVYTIDVDNKKMCYQQYLHSTEVQTMLMCYLCRFV